MHEVFGNLVKYCTAMQISRTPFPPLGAFPSLPQYPAAKTDDDATKKASCSVHGSALTCSVQGPATREGVVVCVCVCYGGWPDGALATQDKTRQNSSKSPHRQPQPPEVRCVGSGLHEMLHDEACDNKPGLPGKARWAAGSEPERE